MTRLLVLALTVLVALPAVSLAGRRPWYAVDGRGRAAITDAPKGAERSSCPKALKERSRGEDRQSAPSGRRPLRAGA